MKIFSRFLSFALFVLLVQTVSGQTTYAPGYTKKNGTYVAPHYKTSPNKTKVDNWSTKPNVNPYTGKQGTVILPDPYYAPVIVTPTYQEFPVYKATEQTEDEGEDKTEATQCLGLTKSGNQCKRMTRDPSGFCYQH
jgi:hypothetical protein